MRKKDKRLKKSGLTKEQLEYLDKCMMEKYWTYWPRAIYDFPNITKLIKEDKNDD